MSGNSPARVSVIVPARNEEANIERAVRSVASQTGEPLEVIVVDDQSDDCTGQILEGMKAEIPALQVIRVASLPAGWLGKTNALAVGARQASGEWLLFTDADTEHRPGSLSKLVERAEQKHVDLLSLSPGQLTPTWWEKAVIPLVYVWLAKHYSFDEVNDPHSKVAAANGQYLLIRRLAYDRVGGHEAVRAEILEDVALAKLVKSSGGRLLFLPGTAYVRTRMYRTFSEMWQGWTKNLYLLAGRDLTGVLVEVAALWFLELLPLAAIPVLGLAAIVGWTNWKLSLSSIVLCLVSLGWRGTRYLRALVKLGFAPTLSGYRIPGAFLVSVLMLGSEWVYRRGGRIQWKGRTYRANAADPVSPAGLASGGAAGELAKRTTL